MGGEKFVSESISDGLRMQTLIGDDRSEKGTAIDGAASTSEYNAVDNISLACEEKR